MALTLGALTLTRTESFSTQKIVTVPRRKILGASSGNISEDAKTWEPDSYRLVAQLNNSDKDTLEGYTASYRTLSDVDSGLSKTVIVESVECDYMIGHSLSDVCWRCSVSMVLSNS